MLFQQKIVKLTNKQNFKDLANCINECIKKNELPNERKAVDIIPIFKKEDPLNKESVPPTISKIRKSII